MVPSKWYQNNHFHEYASSVSKSCSKNKWVWHNCLLFDIAVLMCLLIASYVNDLNPIPVAGHNLQSLKTATTHVITSDYWSIMGIFKKNKRRPPSAAVLQTVDSRPHDISRGLDNDPTRPFRIDPQNASKLTWLIG